MMPGTNTILFITGIYCSGVCTGLLCAFPLHLASHFLYLILEWISWRWNCALNMLQTHLNFNERPALLFGHTGPGWIAAGTDSFQERMLWFILNECICKWLSHKQTPWEHKCTCVSSSVNTPNTVWVTLGCLHPVDREDDFSPAHSIFHCRKNRESRLIPIHVWWKTSAANYETPQSLLCVLMREDSFSAISTYRELHFRKVQSADG